MQITGCQYTNKDKISQSDLIQQKIIASAALAWIYVAGRLLGSKNFKPKVIKLGCKTESSVWNRLFGQNETLSTKGEKLKPKGEMFAVGTVSGAAQLHVVSVCFTWNKSLYDFFQTLQVRLMETPSLSGRERVCSPCTIDAVPSSRPKSMLSNVTSSVLPFSLNRPSALSAKSLSGMQQTEIS